MVTALAHCLWVELHHDLCHNYKTSSRLRVKAQTVHTHTHRHVPFSSLEVHSARGRSRNRSRLNTGRTPANNPQRGRKVQEQAQHKRSHKINKSKQTGPLRTIRNGAGRYRNRHNTKGNLHTKSTSQNRQTDRQASAHTDTNKHIHTYLHAYMHTYIHSTYGTYEHEYPTQKHR